MVARHFQFVPLTPEFVEACNGFNLRLRQAGFGGRFDCSANRNRGDSPPAPMEAERFVGIDAEGKVRGAYLLRWQSLWLRGRRILGASCGNPISEGVIDKQYAMVGASVLRDAVKRCECIYLLGAGGRTGSVFRVAQHAGWRIEDVPFFFRVLNGGRFMLKVPQTQRHRGRRLIASLGNATGLARIAANVLHASSAVCHRGSLSLRLPSNVSVDEVTALADIADEVWSRASSQYAFCVVRDGTHIDSIFPLHRMDLHRLVVRCEGSVIGWSVVMTQGLSRLRAYLGEATPGLIVDAFGDTAHASEIVRASTAFLAARGVDVVMTNCSHTRWMDAYRRCGYITWRSQFPLIVSKPLACRLGDFPMVMLESHLSRGDGDGVYYLH